jgi:DNA-binding GntR family transcriptional regulator
LSVEDLEPLTTTERVTDAVYEALRNGVFSGVLAPGSKLSVPALATRLNVSRSPVREAVVRLTRDRLAVEEPRRGAVVATVSRSQLAELYDVREALEGTAARLAAEKDGPALADRLAEILALHKHAVERADTQEHTELDMRFHSAIRETAGNSYLSELLDQIQAQVRLAMLTTMVTAGPHRALEDHRAIVAALRTGNGDWAEDAARKHIRRLAQALREGGDE